MNLTEDSLRKLQKSLPFLPGHQFNLKKTTPVCERKSHAFDYCNQVPVFKSEAPGIGGKVILGQEEKIYTSVDSYPKTNESTELLPAWVAFDRKELVHERREEKYRIRRVNVYFYLEDDSIHVSEPKTVNSGIPQGTLIRRHRIPRADARNGQHYTAKDFNVGTEISLYQKTIKLVGCDNFTRSFLTRIGVSVSENTTFPADPFETVRKEMLSHMKATRPSIPNLSLKQFLENDRRVLRFYCVWDDRQSVFGDLRHMVIHYYLSDDTIEIIESIPANSGREPNPSFLTRCRLPKQLHVNSWASNDSEKTGYFTDADLSIGSVLHLHGRPFLICDCDEFTKNYYRENYGVENFDPVSVDEFLAPDETAPFFDVSSIRKPEQNGLLIGNDSANKHDFKKLMAYDGITCRFLARLISSKQVDKDRKFVISLHLSDDKISIFEPKSRNSGIIGGKFLENRQIKKPKSNEYYSPKDFYIGAEFVFYDHHFKVLNADEYALKFMNSNPKLFPKQHENIGNAKVDYSE